MNQELESQIHLELGTATQFWQHMAGMREVRAGMNVIEHAITGVSAGDLRARSVAGGWGDTLGCYWKTLDQGGAVVERVFADGSVKTLMRRHPLHGLVRNHFGDEVTERHYRDPLLRRDVVIDRCVKLGAKAQQEWNNDSSVVAQAMWDQAMHRIEPLLIQMAEARAEIHPTWWRRNRGALIGLGLVNTAGLGASWLMYNHGVSMESAGDAWRAVAGGVAGVLVGMNGLYLRHWWQERG